MRPCPFSTTDALRVRSGAGWRASADGWAAPLVLSALSSAGGKGVAEGEDQIGHQLGLVGFDGKQVLPVLIADAWQIARWQNIASPVTRAPCSGSPLSSVRLR